jgi:hypothetical protein
MARRNNYFNSKWLEEEIFRGKLIKVSEHIAKCLVCPKDLNIANERRTSLVDHFNSKSHKNIVSSQEKMKLINNYVMVGLNPNEEEKVAIAEMCSTYHNENHNLSHKSMDCGVLS